MEFQLICQPGKNSAATVGEIFRRGRKSAQQSYVELTTNLEAAELQAKECGRELETAKLLITEAAHLRVLLLLEYR